MKLKLLLIVISLFALQVVSKGQNKDEVSEKTENVRVKIVISTDSYDANVKNEIQLEIEKRLKNISNVSIVEDSPHVMLILYIVKTTNSNINKEGCVISVSHLSYVIQDRLSNTFMKSYTSNLSKDQLGVVKYLSTIGSLDYINVISSDSYSELKNSGVYDKIINNLKIKQIDPIKELYNIYGELSEDYGGIYSFGTIPEEGPTGKIYVYPNSDSTLLFFLELQRGAPSYNLGEMVGEMKIMEPGMAEFTRNGGGCNCNFRIFFKGDSLIIRTINDAYKCGFGCCVYTDGNYKRIQKETPKFYLFYDEKTWFKDLDWKSEWESW
jgi:hypothetical protein